MNKIECLLGRDITICLNIRSLKVAIRKTRRIFENPVEFSRF